MNNNYLSIGEMAKMNHITVTTLRLYDELDLLKPVYVNPETNYRYYDIKTKCTFGFDSIYERTSNESKRN